MRIVRELQNGVTDADDLREIERIVAASPVHARLLAEPWGGDARSPRLAAAGATVQPIGSAGERSCTTSTDRDHRDAARRVDAEAYSPSWPTTSTAPSRTPRSTA